MKIVKPENLDLPDLDGSLDSIIEALIKVKEKYKDFSNLRIDEESTYDGGYYHTLRGDKLETDEEEARRLANDKEHAERKEFYERKQYAELKAKFEKNCIKEN